MKFTVPHFCMLQCMHQIYGMESPIDNAQPPTVWGMHVSTIKKGVSPNHCVVTGNE